MALGGNMNSTTAIFASFQQYITEEQDKREEIRTVVRDLEQKAREILTVVQAIHHQDGKQQIPVICQNSRTMLDEVKKMFGQLSDSIPKDQYYRYNDHFRFVIQRLCFIVALINYLETNQLIKKEDAATMLNVKNARADGFHLDLDDFLMGLLQLASELSRLAVNAVTAGDYGRPMQIAKFVAELDSGFRLLNLKNDSLRKRFDGLKYDLKKIEEVVYDITIRGLKPAEETAQTS